MQVGAYRLVEQIGSGGMGAVWLAEHIALGRRAAVKILHPQYSARPDIVSRFFNEARAASAITDPGIVQIFDYGHGHDGTAYIVMELLQGIGLDRRLREHGPMQPHDALRIIRQVASSLGAAHARGIVHRDLKPENVFLSRDPEVAGGERAKILDFGIAKLQGDRVGWRTETSQVMGTPLYMSPEQCRGAGGVDQRTDVYSLGCVLFVLVTGRPPFLAAGSGDLIAMHLREAPPLASQFSVRVTPDLDHLISKCLEKDPAKRFLNGIEMANAITGLLGTLTASSSPRVAAPSQPALVSNVSTTLSSSTGALVAAPALSTPRRKRTPVLAAIGGAAIVGTVAVVAIISANRAKKPETTSEAKVADSPPPITDAPVVHTDAPAAEPDRRADDTKSFVPVAVGFVKWSASHKGAACPTPKDLAAQLGDPAKLTDSWGHALAITCTDQPATQQIGIVSAGPDGIAGNRDDIASWMLGEEVTDLLTGPRWIAKVKPRPTATRPPPATAGTKPPSSGVKGDLDGDGIPDER
jgi:serine/threonine-protein kinase